MNNKNILTPKQKKFCLEYLKDFNGKQAAIRAGYKETSAEEQASRMLSKVKVQNYIKGQNAKVEKKTIMDIQEIQERLTSMARGELQEEVIVVTGSGEGYSEAQVMKKQICAKDQAKALELLGKANSLFVDRLQVQDPPKIVDDIPEEDE